MGRPKGSYKAFPAYRLHRPSGQAVVTLSGKDHRLGPYDSKASHLEYDRLLAEWIANGRQPLRADDPTVTEVVAAFLAHAKDYYRDPSGRPSGELENYRLALKPLNDLYGEKLATEFGPLALETLMGEMVKLGWCRTHINRQVSRIKHAFAWAVSKQMIPPSVHQALSVVRGYRRGKSPARESDPVRPVADEDVQVVLPHLPPPVKAMVELQRLTGMRPGEVCIIRACDIDVSDPKVWEYRPARHKTAHHGHERVVPLGPRCQKVIEPFITGRPTTAFLFCPKEGQAWRNERQRAKRKPTPMTPSRAARRPKANPERAPGECYDDGTYRQAVHRACEIAFGMPAGLRKAPDDTPEQRTQKAAARAAWRKEHCWSPNQLRHARATEIRREYGLEGAQVLLGHRTAKVTEIYAERNVSAARRIMGEVG